MSFRVGEIHHVAVSVRDLDASIHFYRDLLGLRLTLQMNVGGPSTESGLRLKPGTTGRSAYVQGPQRIGQLELIEWSPPLASPPPPRRAGEPGVFLVAFELTEGQLTEAHKRLTDDGVEIISEPRTTIVENYGPIDVMTCTDPDGTMIELLRLPSSDDVRQFRANAA